ncbi:DESICCATION-RELATED PROTEIN LEA14-RELATED [Salix purpurea]|uniref:DESICCATION-RELATED PROTEIN LEA14-RELATED n=1 Tax=Salix purpurea TaxID=77065 RepID=A0A9Q0PE16_SALPP|nr:DESICCATION-RELATED PROTEIN LEA14-RELATED [Salix purpurea]
MAELLHKAKQFVAEKVVNVKTPEANITDMNLEGVHPDSIDYGAKVSVSNPYGTTIPIGEISYVFKSGGRVIVSGTVPDPGSLKGNDTTMLDVLMKVPHSVLVSLVKDVARDGDIDYELELCLTIDLPIFGNFKIPLNRKGELKLPSLSDMF